jgi:hypothetical protein
VKLYLNIFNNDYDWELNNNLNPTYQTKNSVTIPKPANILISETNNILTSTQKEIRKTNINRCCEYGLDISQNHSPEGTSDHMS